MQIKVTHQWAVDIKTARKIQGELARWISLQPLEQKIANVWAVDVSYSRFAKQGYAVVGVFKVNQDAALNRFRIIEEQYFYHVGRVNFPYIPGYLSFREIPLLLPVLEKIAIMPDLILVDGAGIAHPRCLGLATHLGILGLIPTIGCAKSKLIGEYEIPENFRGAKAMLKMGAEEVGIVLRTKPNCRPLFCSPGNLCTLQDVERLVLAFCDQHRLPEPLRRVDLQTKTLRKLYEN